MDYIALAAELTAGHPDTGAYNADDALAAGQLNAVNRPSVAIDMQEILSFMILENTYKADDGTDTQDRTLWQRLKEVVSLAAVPSAAVANPWGSTAIGTITEIQQLKSHTLYDFFSLSAQGNIPIDLTDSNFQVYLAGAQAAGVMSEAQETALLALSANQQSRGQELGFGTVTKSAVEHARST